MSDIQSQIKFTILPQNQIFRYCFQRTKFSGMTQFGSVTSECKSVSSPSSSICKIINLGINCCVNHLERIYLRVVVTALSIAQYEVCSLLAEASYLHQSSAAHKVYSSFCKITSTGAQNEHCSLAAEAVQLPHFVSLDLQFGLLDK